MNYEERQIMMMKNSLIRGIFGMLNDDHRMDDKDLAYQYLMDVTNSTTEDDIRPLLRSKTYSELSLINLKVGSFLIKTKSYDPTLTSLTPEIYASYGKYKGD